MPKDDVAHNVQVMYEIYKIIEVNGKVLEKNVPYPPYPTKILTVQNNKYKKWYSFGEILQTFPLDQGGRFIKN